MPRSSRPFVDFLAVTARLQRKLPYCSFYDGREQVSFLELRYSPLEFNTRKIRLPNICQIARDGIKARKFESARIHLCDVFAVIAVLPS